MLRGAMILAACTEPGRILCCECYAIMGGLRVLQGCYNGVPKVLQKGCKGVTKVLQRCYKGVTYSVGHGRCLWPVFQCFQRKRRAEGRGHLGTILYGAESNAVCDALCCCVILFDAVTMPCKCCLVLVQ
jgi:hypothetical protein